MSSKPLSPSSSSTSDFENMYSAIGSTYETGFGHDPGLLSFLAKTLPLLSAHSHILDLGSGTGRPVASTLAETGHQVFGLDFSETMVALAKSAVPNATFALGDMRTFEPLEHWHVEEGFDAVFSILSLFIFSREEIEGLVGKWAQWVKKGGLLCLCTIAAEDLVPRGGGGAGMSRDAGMKMGCVRGGWGGGFFGNRVSFTLFGREGWRGLLASHGFEVLGEEADVFRPPVEAESDEEPHWFLVARRV
ncbi:hypothetical protein EYC80_008833 [Monilinia laxa]|uniref:Methyltransferase domain-containing protein n=1 Tax=Monilinia laxa TaxID=61186 RepID=A0A5N6K1M5_MONLA|nr:hypothetical protein EYC80_008833 [Monilinia laxa]